MSFVFQVVKLTSTNIISRADDMIIRRNILSQFLGEKKSDTKDEL